MISFPFDSQVTYDEFGKPIYDRAINSDLYSQKFESYFTTGIFPDPSTNFQVVSGTGMTVVVNPGIANIKGKFAKETTDRTLVVQAANATYDRIDRVVLRLNLNTEVRAIDLYVIEGTPASTPTAPALTRTSSIYEICLANLFITKNNATITQQKITDTRLDTTVCGVCATTITQLDTTTLFNQYQDWFETTEADAESDISDLIEELNALIAGGIAQQLQAEIGTLSDLTTTDKTDLVVASNEINAKANTNATSIGTLASLTTTDKTDLVVASNEINAKKVNQTTAAITYYVATTGSDSNDGASGTPFLTIQHAIDVLPKHLNHNVTINIANGDYISQGIINIYSFVGNGQLSLSGASSTLSKIKGVNIVGCQAFVILGALNFNASTSNCVSADCSQNIYVGGNVFVGTSISNENYGINIRRSNLHTYGNTFNNFKYVYTADYFCKLHIFGDTVNTCNQCFISSNGSSITINTITTSTVTTMYTSSGGGTISTGDVTGVWTPTVTIDGVVKTANFLNCKYTNIGNHRIVSGWINLSGTYTISTLMSISGLPFNYTGHFLCSIYNTTTTIKCYLSADGTNLLAVNFDNTPFRSSLGTNPTILFQLICTSPN